MKYIPTFEEFIYENYLYEKKNEFVVIAAERINKKGELTADQQSDFDTNIENVNRDIAAMEDYLRKLNRWESDEPGHMELLDNEIEYVETKYEAGYHYYDAYLAAEKGNVRKAAASMKKYRALEKTFNNFYKNSVKISKQYGITDKPWPYSYKSIV